MGGTCIKIVFGIKFVVLVTIGIGIWAVLTDRVSVPTELPPLTKTWFGPGERPKSEDSSVKPFKIKTTEAELNDLKSRLKSDLNRLLDPLEDVGFEYGFNTKYLKEVGNYWLNKYDWKKREKLLNKFSQYQTNIDGINVHFLHVKPSKIANKKVVPLLIVHGWPGSIVEFQKIIPLLTEANDSFDFVFEVIAPSIPGYGFSSPSAKVGFNATQCARIFNELMTERLGFKQYYAQGGDWGALITNSAAAYFPEK